MATPLIRWTLGHPADAGFDILLFAIKCWTKYYPEFDQIVCYNKSKPEHIKRLQNENIELFNQFGEYEEHSNKYIWKPESAGWKLCPPRLRQNAHEIICDNDLVLLERCDFINEFLMSKDMFLMSSAIERCFGNFDKYVPLGVKINSGFIGLPPQFDLNQHIIEMQKLSGQFGWTNLFDEQGMLASIFTKQPNFKVIPMDDIYNCFKDCKIAKGMHFCGANAGLSTQWQIFQKMRLGYL